MRSATSDSPKPPRLCGFGPDVIPAYSIGKHFIGHFPGAPIMPGVLLIEACAQLCSFVVEQEPDADKLYVLLKVDGFKFVKPVIPGDVLDISVKKTRGGGALFAFDAEVRVDGNVHAKGSLVFTAVSRDSIYKR